MSLINDLMQRVASLTNRLNEIGANSKRTEEMPLMNPVDRNSLLRVSKGGVSYRIPVQGIVDELSLPNEVIQIGLLEVVPDGLGESLKIPDTPTPIWRINGQEFLKNTETLVPIPYAANDKYRTDLVVADTNSDFYRVEGTEGDFLGLAPNIPANTVEVTRINIFGNQIGNPSPTPTNGFVTKSSKQYRSVHLNSTSPTKLYLSHESTTFDIQNSVLNGSIGGFYGFSSDNDGYDGLDIYIKNSNANPITIVHNESTASTPFNLPSGIDIVLQENHIAHFKLNKADEVVELVGVATDFRIISYEFIIDEMLTDQAQQSTQNIIFVEKAHEDPSLNFPQGETRTYAYYQLRSNSTKTGSLSDYTLISAPYGNHNTISRQIDVVEDIAELKNYEGNSNFIYVSDELRGGFFTKNSNLTDDDGTVFKSEKLPNVYWVRNFDKNLGVNAEWFGAVGDDNTNNEPFFKLAINYCKENKTILNVGEGIFLFNYGDLIDTSGFENSINRDYVRFGIELYDDIEIRGAGTELTVIKVSESSVLDAIQNHSSTASYLIGSNLNITKNNKVSDLKIIGNKQSEAPLLEIDSLGLNGENIIYENLVVEDSQGDGVDFDTFSNVKVRNVRVSNSNGSGFKLAPDSKTDKSSVAVFENCSSVSNGVHGADVRGQNIRFINSFFENNGGPSVGINSLKDDEIHQSINIYSNISIESCDIRDNEAILISSFLNTRVDSQYLNIKISGSTILSEALFKCNLIDMSTVEGLKVLIENCVLDTVDDLIIIEQTFNTDNDFSLFSNTKINSALAYDSNKINVIENTQGFTTQIINTGGNYNDLEVTADLLVFTNENAQAILNGVWGRKEFHILNLSSQYEIQINHDSSSVSGNGQPIMLPTNSGTAGIKETARVLQTDSYGYFVADTWGSKYRPEFSELTEDKVMIVGADHRAKAEDIIELKFYRTNQSTAMDSAELENEYPDSIQGTEVICTPINKKYEKIDNLGNWIEIDFATA